MGKSKEQRFQEIFERSLTAFGKAEQASRGEREQSLEDRRFCDVPGAQWEGPLLQQFENRPRVESNKVHLAVKRVVSEFRNNRYAVDFDPKTAGADQVSDLANGLYRADYEDSQGDESCENCFREGVTGGFGAWRLTTEYENEFDDENEFQRIRFEPIYEADSRVIFDDNCQLFDKSDAERAWVLTPKTHEAFKEEFGEDPTSWAPPVWDYDFDWYTPDFVYIAEYFEKEIKSETFVYFKTLTDNEIKLKLDELDDERLQELIDTGHEEVRRRKVKRVKVHKYLMSGSGVLEDCGYIAGKHIPIIPFYGERTVVKGAERFMGLVRYAKDAQRLSNMLRSYLAEFCGNSSEEVPIFLEGQIDGYENEWADHNIKRYPYQIVKAIEDDEGNIMPSGPVGYTKASAIPPAISAMIGISQGDLEDLLGNPQAAEEMMSNVSGKTVELIQNRVDMQSAIYIENFEKALIYCGKVFLSMAEDIYIEDEREAQWIDDSGKRYNKPVTIRTVGDQDMIETQNMSTSLLNVSVTIGPSSSSRRQATVTSLSNMLNVEQDQTNRQVLSSMIMMNMEGEGVEDAREYYRKNLVKMGVIDPTEEDLEDMKAQAEGEPAPMDQLILAEKEKAESQAANERAKTAETMASAKLKEAQAKQIEADIMGTGLEVREERVDNVVDVSGESLKQQELALKAEESAFKQELEATKLAEEIELKTKQLELEEKKFQLEMAKSGAVVDGEAVKSGYEAVAAEMIDGIKSAMEELKGAMDKQADESKRANEERMKRANEMLDKVSKPKKILRDDKGNVVGVE